MKSLRLVLQLLFGQAPFFAQSIAQTYYQIVNHDVSEAGDEHLVSHMSDSSSWPWPADVPRIPAQRSSLAKGPQLCQLVRSARFLVPPSSPKHEPRLSCVADYSRPTCSAPRSPRSSTSLGSGGNPSQASAPATRLSSPYRTSTRLTPPSLTRQNLRSPRARPTAGPTIRLSSPRLGSRSSARRLHARSRRRRRSGGA